MSVARVQLKRLHVSALPWVLTALTVALLAWTYLQALNVFLPQQDKLATLPNGPGFTDLVAVPLLGQLGQFGLLLAPLICMSMLAGERRHGTLPVLFAAGLSPLRIVLGKFFAAWSWLLLLLLLTVAMPLLLAGATQLDYGKLAAATLGIALLFGALCAIALACSAFTSHPALAAGAAWLVSLALWLLAMGQDSTGVHSNVITWLALPTHLQPMLRGLVASSDLVYFLLLIALALALASVRLGHDKVRD